MHEIQTWDVKPNPSPPKETTVHIGLSPPEYRESTFHNPKSKSTDSKRDIKPRIRPNDDDRRNQLSQQAQESD